MSEQLINGVATTLTTAITSTGQTTGIQVALKPRDAVSGKIRVVLPASLGGEIITCTSLTGSGPYTVAGTVLRAQENTTAGTYPAGTAVEVGGLTASAITSYVTQSTTLDAVATAGATTTQALHFGGGSLSGTLTGANGNLFDMTGGDATVNRDLLLGRNIRTSGDGMLIICGGGSVGTMSSNSGQVTGVRIDDSAGNMTVGTGLVYGGQSGEAQMGAGLPYSQQIGALIDGIVITFSWADRDTQEELYSNSVTVSGGSAADDGENPDDFDGLHTAYDNNSGNLTFSSDGVNNDNYIVDFSISETTVGLGGNIAAYGQLSINSNIATINFNEGDGTPVAEIITVNGDLNFAVNNGSCLTNYNVLDDNNGGMTVASLLVLNQMNVNGSVIEGVGSLVFEDFSTQGSAYTGPTAAQKIRAGSSGGTFAQSSGSLFESNADTASTTSTSIQDLYSHSVFAGALGTNKDKIRATFSFNVVSNTHTKTIGLSFGGTSVFSTALTVSQTGVVVVDVVIIRVSATVVRCMVYPTMATALGTVTPATIDVTGLTLTSAQILKSTCTIGTGATAGDVTAKMDVVEYLPYSGN